MHQYKGLEFGIPLGPVYDSVQLLSTYFGITVDHVLVNSISFLFMYMERRKRGYRFVMISPEGETRELFFEGEDLSDEP